MTDVAVRHPSGLALLLFDLDPLAAARHVAAALSRGREVTTVGPALAGQPAGNLALTTGRVAR